MAVTTGQHGGVQGDHDHRPFKERLREWCIAACIAGATFAVSLLIAARLQALNPPASYSAALSALDTASSAAASLTLSVAGGGGGVGSLAVPALFGLVVRIANPSATREACVYGGATAAVWYNGTLVAEGAVPPFCAGKREEREAAAAMRGVVVVVGDDAPMTWLPTPAEMESRGVVVDVAVRVPEDQYYDEVLACSVEVGGGLSPCTRSLQRIRTAW